MRKIGTPNVNAGSMADIAFLLLIFFLVTATIPKDKGISRKLPAPCSEGQDCSADLAKRNVLPILINAEGEILIDNELISLNDVSLKVISFLDNNGDQSCNYCNGTNEIDSSDNPQKAVISLSSHRLAPYKTFIAVQDELTKAYEQLRKDYAETQLKKKMEALTEEEMQKVRDAYPLKISEAEVR